MGIAAGRPVRGRSRRVGRGVADVRVIEQGHPETAAGTVTVRDGVAHVSGFNGQVPEGWWLWAGDGPLREGAPIRAAHGAEAGPAPAGPPGAE